MLNEAKFNGFIAVVETCFTGVKIVVYFYCGQFYPSIICLTGIDILSDIGRTWSTLMNGLNWVVKFPIQQNLMLIALAG
ncbi:hypothetical protein F994_00854 [Acinetobacter bohemicus ANC 3994]|uniref:Uncharacterized protein n=1 Tax=Acinetobacter bohemicus ANC 3994 TaxID=1217715 RepID=N8QBU4_9GAMM|nr:hypothetical protein [Acinetobacter bohemicus]ENU20628.1 hypothetical protein F994_00854 [Acinetobacter bohemicus ANC 3994]